MAHGIPDIALEVVWGPRGAGLDACAEATVDFLQRLAPYFSGFQTLEEIGGKKNRRLLDANSFKSVLERGVNRTDVGNEVIEDLGYQVGLCARSSAVTSYDIDIVLNLGVTSPAVHNEVSISLGAFDRMPAELMAAVDWPGLMEVLVDAWLPDCGSLTTPDLGNRLRLRKALYIGWLTYLSESQFPRLPSLPQGVVVRHLEGAGHTIDCIPDRFPGCSKQDLRKLKQVHTELARMYLDVNSL
jgi:hypothetical protein